MTSYGWGDWLGNGVYIGLDTVTREPEQVTYAYIYNATASASSVYDIEYPMNSGWCNSLLGGQGQLASQHQQMSMAYNAAYQQTITSNMLSAHYSYLISGMLDGLAGSPPETVEQAAARVEREAKRKAASLRAESLLFTILTPAQVRQYTDDACFDVEVNGRIYRLACNSRSGNVILLEKGKPKFKYCAHPHDAHDVPIPDVLLSQLLMLRSDEKEFLRIANRTVLQ
jgi:hypothetical protein